MIRQLPAGIRTGHPQRPLAGRGQGAGRLEGPAPTGRPCANGTAVAPVEAVSEAVEPDLTEVLVGVVREPVTSTSRPAQRLG